MRRSLLLIAAIVGVTAAVTVLVIELNAKPATASAVSSPDQRHQGSAMATTPRPTEVKTEEDVDRYVIEIEARIRATGVFSRDEVGSAHAAIAELEPRIGREAMIAKGRQFGERMQRAKRELERRPTTDELDRLMKAIVATPDRATRDRLVAQYRVTAAQLPAPYRIEAMTRLEGVVLAPGRTR